MNKFVHKYSPEQVVFIKENIHGHSRKEITAMFNAHFKLELKDSQITAFIKNRHLKNGLDGRFPKGHVSYNEGKGWEPTQFKKGSKPANWMPIGTERVNTDGYVDVKIVDGKLQKNWKSKHILIWEAANGPVPQGKVLIFADGNRLNVILENLLLVSRGELAVMNGKGLITSDRELTKIGVIIADIHLKIGERKKK